MGKYEPTSEGFVAAVDPLVTQEVSSEAEGSSAEGTSEGTLERIYKEEKKRVCRTLSLAFLPSETVRFWLTFIPGTGDRPTGEIIPDLWTFLSASSEKGFG